MKHKNSREQHTRLHLSALALCVFCFSLSATFGQQITLTGDVYSDQNEPLPYATVVLLEPSDSTLINFCITDNNGHFELKKTSKGNYILQTAFIGYHSNFRNLEITPEMKTNLGIIVLQPTSYNINEVMVTGEKVPFLVKGDTIEYNASSFKTRPDDVAEDLLRKLPGVVPNSRLNDLIYDCS